MNFNKIRERHYRSKGYTRNEEDDLNSSNQNMTEESFIDFSEDEQDLIRFSDDNDENAPPPPPRYVRRRRSEKRRAPLPPSSSFQHNIPKNNLPDYSPLRRENMSQYMTNSIPPPMQQYGPWAELEPEERWDDGNYGSYHDTNPFRNNNSYQPTNPFRNNNSYRNTNPFREHKLDNLSINDWINY
jgi:hypothetical protein